MGFYDSINYHGVEFRGGYYAEPFEHMQAELQDAGLVTHVVTEWQENVPEDEYDWPPAEELSTRYAEGLFAADIRKRLGVTETNHFEPQTDLSKIIRTQQQVYVPEKFGW